LSLHLGVARADITPQHPVQLAGFASRGNTPFTRVDQPLFVRAFAFRQEQEQGDAPRHAVLLTADLIWWSPAIVECISTESARRWNLDPDQMVFHASHTHSGPQTNVDFPESIGIVDPAYIEWLEQQTLAAIEQALGNLSPVSVSKGTASCPIGMHRRTFRDGVVHHVGNPAIPVDNNLTLLRFQEPDGRIKALLVHHTCHPTISVDPAVSSEFCGVAMRQLEQQYGDALVAGYLQGSCGDVNAAHLYRTGVDVRGHDEDVRLVADTVYRCARELAESELQPLGSATLGGRQVTVELEVQPVPTVAELQALEHEKSVAGDWARYLLANPGKRTSRVPLLAGRLQIADGCTLVWLGAEATSEFGNFVKAESGGTALPLTYANGSIGYLVTDQQQAEGGYEADGSTRVFGLSGRFVPGTEQVLKNALAALVHGDAPGAPGSL